MSRLLLLRHLNHLCHESVNPGFITVRTASTSLKNACFHLVMIPYTLPDSSCKLSSLDPILCTTDPTDYILVSIAKYDSVFTHQASNFLFYWSTTDTINSMFSVHSSLAIVVAALRSLQDGIRVLIQPLTN